MRVIFSRKPIFLGLIIEGVLLRLIFTGVLASVQLQSKALEDRCSLLFISLSLVLSTVARTPESICGMN